MIRPAKSKGIIWYYNKNNQRRKKSKPYKKNSKKKKNLIKGSLLFKNKKINKNEMKQLQTSNIISIHKKRTKKKSTQWNNNVKKQEKNLVKSACMNDQC